MSTPIVDTAFDSALYVAAQLADEVRRVLLEARTSLERDDLNWRHVGSVVAVSDSLGSLLALLPTALEGKPPCDCS